MRPHEEDEPAEYRGESTAGRYGGERQGGRGPPRRSRYQSPPPRGGPPQTPPGAPQSRSPQTREERAMQRAPQGQQPRTAPPGEPQQGGPPAGGPEYQAGQAQMATPGAGAPGGQPAAPGPAGEPSQRPPERSRALAPIGVEEILETDVATAEPDTPIATVIAQMAEKNVGSVVVVEEDSPVGIVTDRRIVLALESNPDVADRRVEELLAGEFVTGSTEMSVLEVLDRLSEGGIRRLPIVDEDGALAGIVTLDDVLLLFSEELRNVADVLRSQSPRL